MNPFATVDELAARWRPLTAEERTRAALLLDDASNMLREKAHSVGVDLDAMAMERDSYASVLRAVTVDAAARALNSPTDQPAMTQMSQTALGYTVQGSFLTPGGGIYFRKDELARLGLSRQRIGVIELYGHDSGPAGPAGCAHAGRY